MESSNRTENQGYQSVQSAIQSLTVAINGIRIFTFVSEKINQLKYSLIEGDAAKDVETIQQQPQQQKNIERYTMTEAIINKVNSVTRQISFGLPDSTQGLVVRLRTRTLFEPKQEKPKLKRVSTSQCCLHGKHYSADNIYHPLDTCYQHAPRNIWEPYIKTGYLLPYMPWLYYLRALYLPTFELLNIWTHFLPCLYFMYKLLALNQEMNLFETWPVLLLIISSIAVLLCSSLAHMFHSRSGFDHCWWFMVDYYGITSYAYGITLVHFIASSRLPYTFFFSKYNLYLTLVICSTGFVCCCLTQISGTLASIKRSRRMKMGVNALGYFYGCIPLFHRLYLHTTGHFHDPIIYTHFCAVVCMVSAPILYGRDIPQRYWPGKFDIVGHSHQIFHILTASAMYFTLVATLVDVSSPNGPWLSTPYKASMPTLNDVGEIFIFLTLFSFVVGVFLRNLIKPDFNFEKDFREGRRLCLCGLPQTSYETNEKKMEAELMLDGNQSDHVHSVPPLTH